MDDVKTRAEARYRRAGEQVVGDSSLRDALTDEQGQQLLEWGLDQVRREVERTVNLPSEDADPLIEKRVNAVRRVMKQANKLVEGLSEATKGRTREYMMQFVDALCEIDYRAVHVNDMMALEKLALNREEMDRDDIFARLMSIVWQDGEEE